MTEIEFIMWIDPGVVSGVALYNLVTGEPPLVGEHEFADLIDHLDLTVGMLAPWLLMGVERFVLTSLSHRRSGSIEAIMAWGVCRAAAVHHKILLLVEDQRSEDMAIASDEVLRALGWYTPGKPHANDACRHVFAYLASTSKLTTDQRAAVAGLLST